MNRPAVDGFITVAEVVKAVGMRGEIKLLPRDDWYEPLLGSRFLCWEDGTPVRIIGGRWQAGGWVVRVEQVLDREAAEAVVGRRVGFQRDDYLAEDFPRPATGLPFQLRGREVVTVDGCRLGWVTEVRHYGSQSTLVLLRAGRELLIPAVPPILRDVPGLDGPLVVDPPEGLLDGAGD